MKKHGSVGYTKLSFLGNKRSYNKFFMCKVNFSLYRLTQMQSKCQQRFWFDLAHYFKRCYSSQRWFLTLVMCFWKMFYCLQLRHLESFHLCKSRRGEGGASGVLLVCFTIHRLRVKCHWYLFCLLSKTHLLVGRRTTVCFWASAVFLQCFLQMTSPTEGSKIHYWNKWAGLVPQWK